MRLVSDQPNDDLALRRAAQEVDATLRELIANILRVSRGAGTPWKVLDHLGDLVQALKAYSKLPGADLFDFEGCLRSIFSEDRTRTSDGSHYEWGYAEEQMVRGAMQIVASRFVGQKPQEAAGHKEMFEGLITIERLREQNRQARAIAASSGTKESAAAYIRGQRVAARLSAAKPNNKPKPSGKT